MSMCYSLHPASDATLRRLFETPELIGQFLGTEPSTARKRSGFLARLFGRGSNFREPEPATERDFTCSVEPFDLDKSWHGLHFLFTGSVWEGDPPQGFLLSWGREIGDVDVGYGPARGLLSDEIRQVNAFLDGVDAATLRQRFDPIRMAELEIYPNCWMRDPEEEFVYLVEFLEPLKDFVRTLAERQLGVVVQLA